MPYIPQAGIGAIGIESGAHVKVADFGPTQTAQFKLHAQLRFATGLLRSVAGTEIAGNLAVHLNLQEPAGIVRKLPSTCELRCRVCVSKLREYLREYLRESQGMSGNRSGVRGSYLSLRVAYS
jgi:hypothetical protein